MIELILQQNYFSFQDKYYQMTDGLCMGSPISGLIPDIFVDNIEKILFTKYKHLTKYIDFYGRYVDDILIIWSGNNDNLIELHNCLNNISKLKFTLEKEINKTINFLDLSITRNININTLTFDIYRKPTSTENIIPYHSFHNPATKNLALIYYLQRLIQTPLTKEYYLKEYNYMNQLAKNNKYPATYINNLLKHCKKAHTSKLIYPNIQNKSNLKFISVTYQGKYLTQLTKFLKAHNIITTFRNNPNLGQSLVNNKNRTGPLQKSGIYQLNCQNCSKLYIGLTTRNLRTRFTEHVKNKNNSKFGTHLFNNKHQSTLDNVKLLYQDTNFKRLLLYEQYFINKFYQEDADNLLNDESTIHFFLNLPPFN